MTATHAAAKLGLVRCHLTVLGSVTLAIELTAVGCKMPMPPGELVGKYAITSALIENTCGEAALPVAETLAYNAELRADGLNAYWLVGAPPARLGRVRANGEYSFELLQQYAVREGSEPIDPVLAEMDPITLYGYDPLGEPSETETAPCTLIIAESVNAHVLRDALTVSDAGTPDGTGVDLEGVNVIEMRASAGSNCARVLETAGGPFQQLPCAARYELSGALLEVED